MNYYYILKVKTLPEFEEILKAEFAQIGFDSFLDSETYFETSIPAENYEETSVQEIVHRYEHLTEVSYSTEKVKKENWNKLWETYYEPIRISDQCLIRADFHEVEEKFAYELIINPKMSFGTGHHETTSQMVTFELETDFQGKKVADLGCGTGVLSIMAKKLGAKEVKGCDIDQWAVENTEENAQINQTKVEVFKGTVKNFQNESDYDIVLANINLNVLLEEIPRYFDLLRPEGMLFLSGFYLKDFKQIQEKVAQNGGKFQERKVKRDWTAAKFIKVNA